MLTTLEAIMSKRIVHRFFEAKNQTMKRHCSTLIDYEKTLAPPMKRP